MLSLLTGLSPMQPDESVTALGGQVNMLWVVIGAILVIFMQAGFALVETGLLPCQARRPRGQHELRHLRPRLHRASS